MCNQPVAVITVTIHMNATKIISSAVIGYDFRKVVVAGKLYLIHPPTIHKLAGAAYWLSQTGDVENFSGLVKELEGLVNVCNALSFFISGDESLTDELRHGTMEEVLKALEAAFELISPQNFLRLSRLRRSAAMMTAKQTT